MDSNRVTAASLLLIVVFISGVVLKLARPVLFPFFLAIFLSFTLYPVLDFLTRFKIPRSAAIVLILLVTFFIVYLLGALLYSSGKTFAAEWTKYGQKINDILASIFEKLPIPSREIESFNLMDQLNLNRAGNLLLSTLGTFFSFLSNLFLILIFLVFILAGRGETEAKFFRSFKRKQAETFVEIKNNIDSQIQRYLGIKTIISFITGLLATIVLLFFGVDFAILFGFLTFILNYIPNIGSIIATALPLIIALFQFDTLWPAFWIFIILSSIQMVFGNFIEPKVMGQGLGISPLVILFSLFFWGWLWGLPGMILAVPIVAIIKIVTSNIPQLEFISILVSRK
ncbi:MAG: AI-2E family transporter [Candidatus Aminicenantes bacterium]|nr:AI-2E family transporter [Candidatus Aminicenantes bacterium]